MELLLKKKRKQSAKGSALASRGAPRPADCSPTTSRLWQDKYQPTDVKTVAAHASKKKAVRDWLIKTKEKALFQKSLKANSPNFKPSVLVLCGCSGSCKSTLVEVTAKELRIPLVQWHEDLLEGQSSEVAFNPFLTGLDFVESRGGIGSGRIYQQAATGPHSSSAKEQMLEELNEFAMRSAYSSLKLVSPPPASIRNANPTLNPPHFRCVPSSTTLVPSSASSTLDSSKAKGTDSGVDSTFSSEISNVIGAKKRKLLHSILPIDVDVDDDTNGDDIDDFDDDDSSDYDMGRISKRKQNPHLSYHSSDSHSLHRSDSVRSTNSSSSSSSGYNSSGAFHDNDAFCSVDRHASLQSSHQVILVHDPTSLASLADTASASYSSVGEDTHRRRGNSSGGSSEGLCSQLLMFQHPVVLILSDVGDRDAMYWTIKDLFPDEAQTSLDLEVVFCTPITVLNAKKVLRNIAETESKNSPSQELASGGTARQLQVPPDHVLEAIATACLGDLRQAISQLQMYMIGRAHPSSVVNIPSNFTSASCPSTAGGKGVVMDTEAGSRDKSFSFLHGVAKLLWAEVHAEQSSKETDNDPAKLKALYKLKFPPDSVIRRLDLPLDMSMSFLQFNYPAIFERMESMHNLQKTTLMTSAEKDSENGFPKSLPPMPMPTYDSLERAERLADMLSEADILHTCQFSTNLPIDRAQGSSFPLEYVESICSRAPACSMYPPSKTPLLFHGYHLRRQEQERLQKQEQMQRGTGGKHPCPISAIGDAYDHLTGTSGVSVLKRTTSSGMGGKFVPICRPTILNVKKQASVITNLTRDLRAALVSHVPSPLPPHSTHSQRNNQHPPCSSSSFSAYSSLQGGESFLQSFDYVVKQAARARGEIKCHPSALLTQKQQSSQRIGAEQGSKGKADQDQGCLPVSFLSSTELITVMVPYLKCLVAMHNQQKHNQQQQQHTPSVLLHPSIQKHVIALMGTLSAVEDLTGDQDGVKRSVLIGRHHQKGRSSSSNSAVSTGIGYGSSHEAVAPQETQWDLVDELDEFSD